MSRRPDSMLTFFKNAVCRLTALALVIWLAAPGCAAGCKMGLTGTDVCRAAVDEMTLSAPASMSDASEHACCQWPGAEHDQQSPVGFLQVHDQGPKLMPCCTAGSRVATAALRPKVIPTSAVTQASEVTPHPPAATLSLAGSARTHSPPTYGGHTHLRCCVFLI
jgi:hypothetical protein